MNIHFVNNSVLRIAKVTAGITLMIGMLLMSVASIIPYKAHAANEYEWQQWGGIASDYGYDVAIDSTGSWLYMVGRTDDSTNRNFFVTKIQNALPSTIAYTRISDDVSNEAKGVALSATHMFIVGNEEVSSGKWRVEKRDLATGALDATFGLGGIATSSSIMVANAVAEDIVLDGTHMYIVGYDGSATGWVVEKRSMTTGALDITFDGDGVAYSPATAKARAVSHDGTNLYIVGETAGLDWRIEKRLMSDGSIVAQTTSVSGNTPYTVVYDGSSSVYIGGNGGGGRVEKRPIADITLLDGTFGSVTDVNLDTVYDVVIDGTDLYLAGQSSSNTHALQKRSTSDGSLNNSFSGDGQVYGTMGRYYGLTAFGSDVFPVGVDQSALYAIVDKFKTTPFVADDPYWELIPVPGTVDADVDTQACVNEGDLVEQRAYTTQNLKNAQVETYNGYVTSVASDQGSDHVYIGVMKSDPDNQWMVQKVHKDHLRVASTDGINWGLNGEAEWLDGSDTVDDDLLLDIAHDNGNVFAIGASSAQPGACGALTPDYQWRVVQLDQNNLTKLSEWNWNKVIACDNDDYLTGITVTHDSVYVVGHYRDNETREESGAVMRLTAGGSIIAADIREFDFNSDTQSDLGWVSQITSDANGVYAVGSNSDLPTGDEWVTYAFNNDGSMIDKWVPPYMAEELSDAATHSYGAAIDIEVDNNEVFSLGTVDKVDASCLRGKFGKQCQTRTRIEVRSAETGGFMRQTDSSIPLPEKLTNALSKNYIAKDIAVRQDGIIFAGKLAGASSMAQLMRFKLDRNNFTSIWGQPLLTEQAGGLEFYTYTMPHGVRVITDANAAYIAGGDRLQKICLNAINEEPYIDIVEDVLNDHVTGNAQNFALSVTDPESDLVDITIDWGDGTTDTMNNVATPSINMPVTHTWATAGLYTIIATADDGNGNVVNDWLPILIQDPAGGNLSPTITAQEPGVGNPANDYRTESPQLAQFHVEDADACTQSFKRVDVKVNWGDGRLSSYKLDGSDCDVANLMVATTTLSHSYTAGGTYMVYATATDMYGAENAASFTWTIGQGPIVSISGDGQYVENVADDFSFYLNEFDGDLPLDLEIDWDYTGVFTADHSVLGIVAAPGTEVLSHTYTAGSYVIRARVTDSAGEIGYGQLSIDVGVSVAPTVTLTPANDGVITNPQNLDINIQDSDGDVPTSIEIDWDYDGSTFTLTPDVHTDLDGTIPANTTDLVSPAGYDMTASNTYGAQGVYEVAVRATDMNSNTTVATTSLDVGLRPAVTITEDIANDSIVGNPQVFTVVTEYKDGPSDILVEVDWTDDGTYDYSYTITGPGDDTRDINNAFSPSGNYTVRVRATDQDGSGFSGENTIGITIGVPPTIVLSERSGNTYLAGDDFAVIMSIYDPDQEVVGVDLDWGDATSEPTVNTTPIPYAIEYATKTNYINGEYTVTATVDDGFHPPVSSTIVVDIGGTTGLAAPAVSILSPATSPTVVETSAATDAPPFSVSQFFNGNCTDADDGGACINPLWQWVGSEISGPDAVAPCGTLGVLANTQSFTNDFTISGPLDDDYYKICLRAQDQDGYWSQWDSVRLEIYPPPLCDNGFDEDRDNRYDDGSPAGNSTEDIYLLDTSCYDWIDDGDGKPEPAEFVFDSTNSDESNDLECGNWEDTGENIGVIDDMKDYPNDASKWDGGDDDGDGYIDQNDPGCWTNTFDSSTYSPFLNEDNCGNGVCEKNESNLTCQPDCQSQWIEQ